MTHAKEQKCSRRLVVTNSASQRRHVAVLGGCAIAMILTALLTGCKQSPINVAADVCPTLFPYSRAFQLQLATEVEEIMSRYPAVVRVVTDNGATRNQIRACIRKVRQAKEATK